MTQKQMAWKVKGMNQDLSVSAFNPEFAFENHNLRLSTNENNTTLSWVNEKGTGKTSLVVRLQPWDNHSETDTVLDGVPIGTAVANDKLVIFTTGNTDSIYVLTYTDFAEIDTNGNAGQFNAIRIYNGKLNFNAQYPLETLVSYESSSVVKVYWTDGINQPRVINIAADSDKIRKWNHDGETVDIADTFFDFIPCMQLEEDVVIERMEGGGTFAPGTIQYCFTYINKYQQQSNVVYQSPLYYLAHGDRGASPEDKVSSSFRITVYYPDTGFDYLRLYSIQRTSVNDTPYVKLISDIRIPETGEVTYLDNGTTGSAMDPTELLYAGGREIHALTMAAKDQTLFLGNITEVNSSISDIQEYFRNPGHIVDIEYKQDNVFNSNASLADCPKTFVLDHVRGVYSHTNQLNRNQREITTFKGGETYRFGFQLQKHTGEWSEPIFLGDYENHLYPRIRLLSDFVNLVYATGSIDVRNSTAGGTDYVIDPTVYKKARPLIVFPNVNDRTVVCQGVLNPTVFNAVDRINSFPYAQASWYFRPYTSDAGDTASDVSQKEITQPDTRVSFTSRATGSTRQSISYNGSVSSDETMAQFISQRKIQLVSVLVAQIDAGYEEVVFNNSRHALEYGSSNGYTIYSFNPGIIPLKVTDDDTDRIYAFLMDMSLCDTGWPWPDDVNSYRNLTVLGISDRFYQIYNGLDTNSWNWLYFSNDETDSPVNFKFNVKNSNGAFTFYEVTFGDTTADGTTYTVTTTSSAGNNVAFKHFDALPCADDSGVISTRVEIQGSKNLFANGVVTDLNPQGGEALDLTKTNTGFFIDQSVVTLNSPDIEFDTAVQTCSTGNLKLRIVGIIPVTASVSSHSITTASDMLPLTFEENNTTDYTKSKFGHGESSYNVLHQNVDKFAGRRLVAAYLWNDASVTWDGNKVETSDSLYDYMVYPWHRTGPLNNDTRSNAEASSVLETKKEANLLYSINTEYFAQNNVGTVDFDDLGLQMHLTENSHVYNIKLPKQNESFGTELNYYPNIDKVLYNTEGYSVLAKGTTYGTVNGPISLKYRSTSHAVIALNAKDGEIPILPSGSGIGRYSHPAGATYRMFWDDTFVPAQSNVDITDFASKDFSFLWLGEIYKDVENRFGGTSETDIRNNVWLIGGDAVDLYDEQGIPKSTVTLKWTEGDTYYQRYDCLKTYPMSPADTNQLVEILSFMCETRTNIDGRYDKNRGQKDNTEMTPQNFNLLNPAYTQQNNFFNYRQLDNEVNRNLEYPNQICFTKTKTSGADVDLWTNINLGSTLELEGDKGAISKIVKFNDALLAFQEKGISQILYNENVQIASTTGVPIEIANSGKVQGARYISDSVGCSNKWSVVSTASGVYFIDSSNKAIYLFNGQLNNITLTKGMNTWAKRNTGTIDDVWYPGTEGNAFVSYYDKQNNDVLFINKDKALAFNEKMDAFTSFYDYGDIPYFVNFRDTGIWIRDDGTLWKHQGGNYCNFFDEQKPYWMQLVGNAEPNLDKIFTNLEFRATVDGDGTFDEDDGFVSPLLPFDRIEVWNEYQHGITSLENWNRNNYGMWHYISDTASALNRKFRIWRCDIPRDNVQIPSLPNLPENPTEEEQAVYDAAVAEKNAFIAKEHSMGIFRYAAHPINRMRNTWLYLKLKSSMDRRTEIHDMVMTYYL